MRRVIVLVALASALGVIGSAGAAPQHQTATTAITVKAGEFFFKLSKSSIAKPGTVAFAVKNVGHLAHDFKIAGKKTALIQPGKSWAMCPAFFTVNTTVPGLAIEVFESLKKNSPAFTWTVDVAAPALPTTPSAHTSARRTMTLFMDGPLLEGYEATVSVEAVSPRRST